MKHHFFALIKQFEVENELVQSNFPKYASLALEHAENTARLLKDIFYFDEDNSNYTSLSLNRLAHRGIFLSP